MTAPRLKTVGHWIARDHLDTTACVGWIHPHNLTDPGWRTHQRAAILGYLRSGAEWAGYHGRSQCRFAGCTGHDLGSTDRTDGEWLWPEGLAHYVEVHDVRLPDAFVDAMAARRFTVPALARQQRRQGLDGEPWMRWCADQLPAPAAHPDAISLAEAQQLAAALSVDGYEARIESLSGRWLVAACFPGARVVDLLPPCSAELLALHLHRWRRVPPEQQLSIETARQILAEVIAPPTLWQRLAAVLSPGHTPAAVDLDAAGFWRLTSGTVSTAVMPLDETGWRFLLTLLSPGNPAAYDTINRRLYGAFCQP